MKWLQWRVKAFFWWVSLRKSRAEPRNVSAFQARTAAAVGLEVGRKQRWPCTLQCHLEQKTGPGGLGSFIHPGQDNLANKAPSALRLTHVPLIY